MASKLQMRFWVIEVKSGESVIVEPRSTLIHLSQTCLDEVKKGKNNDSISLFVKIDDQKLVLGHLYTDKIPQLYLDLVFDKKFVLSHDGKSGSVHIQGYIADTNGSVPNVSIVEAKNENVFDVKDSSSDGDDENDDESEDEESDQVKSVEDSSDDDESDTEDYDSEDEPEETPNKAKVGKKRAAENSKTPVQKKAKFVTPEKLMARKELSI